MNEPRTPTIEADESRRLLHDMIRVRVLEERCGELYGESKIRGFLHLYIGEEAVAAGVVSQLRPTDAVLGTYREHAHALLKGVSARSIMAEMFGKADGCSGGRGGSMHLFDAKVRFYGGNAIVGGHLPMAVGMALADQQQATDRLTACFFGEGAIAEGEFHEAMNLAALWRVPVLFCCENNRYAMGTSLSSSESQTNLALKAASYEMPAWTVDGMDVESVAEAASRAIDSVRNGGGPIFLDLQTYRFRAHSMFDPDLYRPKEEVERWKERDPISAWSKRLRDRGQLDDEAETSLWDAARAEVDDAVDFAEASGWEPIESMTDHVYSRSRPTERAAGPGDWR